MDSALSLPVACPDCAARMPETAAFCPGCGRPMTPAPAPVMPASQPLEPLQREETPPVEPAFESNHTYQEKVGILRENLGGALAYFTFLPAIVFLARAPYRGNRFLRFHSVQCLLLWVVALAAVAALRLAALLLAMIPVVGPLLVWLIVIVGTLAAFVLWLMLTVKAAQGEWFKLPVLGEFAERHAVAP